MRREPDDAGLTLLELIVAMTIMSIFGLMFVSGITQMYQVANRTSAAATALSQINIAFQRLDGQIRYAGGFSTPGPNAGTDQYVEYLTANTGTEICGELRFQSSTSQLRWRQWNHGGTPGGWTVLASNVTSSTPFAVTAPASGSAYQTLTLTLTSAVYGRTKAFRTTFAALNSTTTVNSSAYCVEGRQVP